MFGVGTHLFITTITGILELFKQYHSNYRRLVRKILYKIRRKGGPQGGPQPRSKSAHGITYFRDSGVQSSLYRDNHSGMSPTVEDSSRCSYTAHPHMGPLKYKKFQL